MWTIESIKARWVEAADVERRLPVKGLPASGNAWPVYGFDEDDRKGWVQADIDEERDRWSQNKATTTPEVTRWEEVFFVWTMLLPQDRRELIWAWARCAAGADKRAFSTVCERKGWVKSTAYLRLDKLWVNLLAQFCITSTPFRPAADRWDRQFTDAEVQLEAQSSEPRPSDMRASIHPPFRTDSHHDALTTPEAVEAFEAHLVDHNDRQRRLRERRLRKSLAGVPDGQKAA